MEDEERINDAVENMEMGDYFEAMTPWNADCLVCPGRGGSGKRYVPLTSFYCPSVSAIGNRVRYKKQTDGFHALRTMDRGFEF